MKTTIVFVEDDATLRLVLEREIRAFGYAVHSFASAEDALAQADFRAAQLGVFDLRLPGKSGIELLEAIQPRFPELPVIFLTGQGSLQEAVRAMRAGAYDFLVKPASLEQLELTLKRALDHAAMRAQNERLRGLVNRTAEDTGLIGSSPGMQALQGAIARVASSEANVLILGENGTGKELVARAIHAESPRHAAPFVVVNCGAVPAELFESELFGHSRGAFTGADKKRPGLFELAEGGTLFLDEIGELPIAMQPTLLRAVQFGEFRSVGSDQVSHADVRLLAATNRDLGEAVVKGEFREDLYHRVSTLVVSIPPLRDRHADVVELAEFFLAKLNRSAAEPKRLTPLAHARLKDKPWTGNVRELENVMIRLFTLVDGAVLDAKDLDAHMHTLRGREEARLETLDLAALERQAVVQALRRHRGARAQAAAELGVANKTLYNKIQQHGIDAAEWEGA